MTAILVTGGAGYVGAHTCKALSRAGYLPVVYDNLARGHAAAVKWGPLERGDLLDRERLVEVMQRYRTEAVMHFAGYAYVWESVRAPALYYRNNVAGSLILLDAMHEVGVQRIVFSSSCAVYGLPERVPISEDQRLRPLSPYGRTKQIVEDALRDHARGNGLRAIALRYFNAAGADPEGETGALHVPETRAVQRALFAALGLCAAFEIHGNDYLTADGTCVRDYVHVADLADAHLRALAALDVFEGFTAYNLGTGCGVSVREIVGAVEQIIGKKVPLRESVRRPAEPPVLVADASRAVRELGWRPAHSDLATIIATAARWIDQGLCSRERDAVA